MPRFRVTRLGDLNVGAYNVNLGSAGTATAGGDYYIDLPLTFDFGQQTVDVQVHPIEDNLYEGDETITLTVAPASAGEYTAGTPNSASATLVDATTAPETILFSENFNAENTGNWNLFVTGPEYTATFAYDYNSLGIPPAPHGSGDTLGLYLTANKGSAGSATAHQSLSDRKEF